MSIDVDKIARLAALEIKPEDKASYEHDLTNILSLIEQMNQTDVTNVQPMAHPFEAEQRLRADEITADVIANGQYDKLQGLTKHVEAGLYLVPQVIE